MGLEPMHSHRFRAAALPYWAISTILWAGRDLNPQSRLRQQISVILASLDYVITMRFRLGTPYIVCTHLWSFIFNLARRWFALFYVVQTFAELAEFSICISTKGCITTCKPIFSQQSVPLPITVYLPILELMKLCLFSSFIGVKGLSVI